jgi:iron complex outermembrane receptor protein
MHMHAAVRFTATLFFCAAFARAQTNAPAPVDLGTILVEGTPISKYRAETVSTASFADAKPEELPVVVDVLTEDFIEEMNPTDLHDLLRYEPGIYTGGKTTYAVEAGRYTIRGMGGSEAMLDGTLPLGGPAMGTFMDPTAFERIEIVKGPVGSTSGGITSSQGGAGGSINLVLKKPVTDRDFLNVTARSSFAEDSQRYRLGYDVNETVVDDKLTVRLPGNIEYGKPFWLQGSYRWRESFFLAPSLLWELREDLRIGVNTTFQYTDQPGYQGIPIYRGKPYGDYDWDSNTGTSRMRDKYIGYTVQPYLEWDVSEVWTLRSGFGLAQADMEFEHMGPGGFATATGAINPNATLYEHQEGDYLSRAYNVYQRATATFDTGPLAHQVVLQGDYTRRDNKGRALAPNAVGTNNRYENRKLGTAGTLTETELDRYGILAQDYVSWWKFRFLGGARFDHHESNLGNTGDSLSPRGGITFLPVDRIALFGNISLTEAPNFGYLKNATEELTSSWRATQYETGVRVSPIETFWISTSVYRIEQEKLPTLIEGTTYYDEEGETESQGVEVSMTGNLADNWSVYAAYTYNEYENRTTGIKFDRYPPHSVIASTSYRIAGGPLNDIVLGLGYRYRDRYFSTIRGSYISDDFYIEESHVFDCSADIPLHKFGGPKDVTLSLAVKNIFGEEYIESNRHYYQCFPGDPRTFEVALSAKF